MRYPPRLAHLATRAVIAAKLAPSYAKTHTIEDEEAVNRLLRALSGPLWEELLGLAWEALLHGAKRLDDAGLVEKVARSLGDRPLRPGRESPETPQWSAFWLEVDLAAGTASEAARRALESTAGRQMMEKGRVEAGQFLATELTR